MTEQQADLDDRIPEKVEIVKIASAPLGFKCSQTGKYEIQAKNPKAFDTSTADVSSDLVGVCESIREALDFSNFRIERVNQAGAGESLQFEAQINAIGFDITEQQILEIQEQACFAIYLRGEHGLDSEQSERYEACAEGIKNLQATLLDTFLTKKANGKILTPVRIKIGDRGIEMTGNFANLKSSGITCTEKEVHGVVEMLNKQAGECGLRYQEIDDQALSIRTLKAAFSVSKYWSGLYAALDSDLPLKFLLQRQIDPAQDGKKLKMGEWTIEGVSDPLDDFELG